MLFYRWMQARRNAGWAIMLALGAYALLYAVAKPLSGDLSLGRIPEPVVRGVLHFLGYGGMAILLGWMLRRRWLLAGFLALVVGALDELHQLYVPGRYCTFSDWLINAAGVVTAVTLTILLLNWRQQRRRQARA